MHSKRRSLCKECRATRALKVSVVESVSRELTDIWCGIHGPDLDMSAAARADYKSVVTALRALLAYEAGDQRGNRSDVYSTWARSRPLQSPLSYTDFCEAVLGVDRTPASESAAAGTLCDSDANERLRGVVNRLDRMRAARGAA